MLVCIRSFSINSISKSFLCEYLSISIQKYSNTDQLLNILIRMDLENKLTSDTKVYAQMSIESDFSLRKKKQIKLLYKIMFLLNYKNSFKTSRNECLVELWFNNREGSRSSNLTTSPSPSPSRESFYIW